MDNKETFQMTYRAQEQDEIREIRKKYLPAEEDKMAKLRALDARAGRKATAVSVAVGVVGTLLLGIGMSLTMTDFGTFALGNLSLPVGIAVGVVGIAVLSCAYPLYTRTLAKERRRNAPEVLRLTDELMR